ncbi:MAG: class I SAM-dependent methyltransferase [Isosphaeraceae bacterium]
MPTRGTEMARPVDADHEHEFEVLTTETGRKLLDAAAALTSPGPADLERLRRTASPALVSAALRLAATRRRARDKFDRADRMWFEPTGLEQATAERVARHKARRFAHPDRLVVDLCCGVGGDALALSEVCGRGVIAVDSDPAMLLRTRWNVAAYGAIERLLPVVARAERFPIPRDAWIHVDPDRRAVRAEGRRARSVDDYAPGLDFLRVQIQAGRHGALKLSPASDFAAHFDEPELEIELVSQGGECKEATIWMGDARTCRRRATVLPSGATWISHTRPAPGAPLVRDVGRWVFDPDPSLSRSGLLDDFARAHQLARFNPGVDFLTHDDSVESPFLARFEVQAVVPLDFKRLRRELRARDVGPLVIKTRGVRVRPEDLRARLGLNGSHPMTLLLAGGDGPAARDPRSG